MRRLLLLPLLLMTVAGCGSQRAPADTRADSEGVVRAWSDAMRRGDLAAATKLFAIPATVANGTPEATLTTAGAIRAFNASLPCGSTVSHIVPHAGVLIVRFVLTDRPGADCGDGVGRSAHAALKVRDGRIVSWIRIEPGGGAPPGELV